MEEEKKKKLIQVLVVVTTIIIFAFWIMNTKYFFQNNSFHDNQKSIDEIKDEFLNDFDELRDKMESIEVDKIKEEVENNGSSIEDNKELEQTGNEDTVGNNDVVTSPINFPGVQIPENNGGTAPENNDNINKTNCPAWINCMPSIGEPPRDCTIPKGCEGITQIAY